MRFSIVFLIVNVIALQGILVVLAKPVFEFPLYLLGEYAYGLGKKAYESAEMAKLADEIFKTENTSIFPPNDGDVRFWCINRSQSRFQEVKLNDSEVKTKINFNEPINFVIHGFIANIDPMFKIAKDWTRYANCNVCVVDWRPLSGEFKIDFGLLEDIVEYPRVSKYFTRLTSNAIHRFMVFLEHQGMNVTQVSIAGHSLGAHIAGFVGASFGGKIDAIYGLDPAGPGFEDADEDSKLYRGDAQYVQCIYTDANTLGTHSTYGDGDGNFYMNGGEHQPGCYVFVGCDHSRAYEYFSESLIPGSQHEFWAYKFPTNYDMYKRFELEDFSYNRFNVMDKIGIHSNRIKGAFIVETLTGSPYPKYSHDKLEEGYSILNRMLDLHSEHIYLKKIRGIDDTDTYQPQMEELGEQWSDVMGPS